MYSVRSALAFCQKMPTGVGHSLTNVIVVAVAQQWSTPSSGRPVRGSTSMAVPLPRCTAARPRVP